MMIELIPLWLRTLLFAAVMVIIIYLLLKEKPEDKVFSEKCLKDIKNLKKLKR